MGETKAARGMTARYAAIQGSYFMAYAAIYSYASAFLLSRGFLNSEIGLVMALSNVLAAVVQSAAATYADRPGAAPVKYLTVGMTAGAIVLAAALFLLPGGKLLTAVLVVAVMTLLLAVQPLISAMGFEHINRGVAINYGLARGTGSISYGAATFVLGQAVALWGEQILPLSYVLLLGAFACATVSFRRAAQGHRAAPAAAARGGSPLAFLARYPRYTVLLIGLTLIFTQHYAQNNYLLQILTNLGGDSQAFGLSMSLSAVMELPAMLSFSRLVRRFSASTLLKVSCVFYLCKALVITTAPTLTVAVLAQTLQMLAFALYTPASVYYANMRIDEADRVKGQAYLTMTMMLGGVFGSLFGGFLIDRFGFAVMQWSLTAVSAAGMAISLAAIERVDTRAQTAA